MTSPFDRESAGARRHSSTDKDGEESGATPAAKVAINRRLCGTLVPGRSQRRELLGDAPSPGRAAFIRHLALHGRSTAASQCRRAASTAYTRHSLVFRRRLLPEPEKSRELLVHATSANTPMLSRHECEGSERLDFRPPAF